MNEQQQRALAEGLRALAGTSRDCGASRSVERAVLAAMDGRPARGAGWSAYAVAAVLVMSSMSGAWLAHRASRGMPGPIHPAGFVEVPGASALPPMESGSIVRVTLPVTTLPLYGLPILPDAAETSVDADLLIAQDGTARAVRLANDRHVSRSTP